MGKDGKVSGYLESEAYIAALDDRERTILALLEEGLSNAEISNRLYLSEPTVKKAIGSILRKLHVNNRVQCSHVREIQPVELRQLWLGAQAPCPDAGMEPALYQRATVLAMPSIRASATLPDRLRPCAHVGLDQMLRTNG